MWYAVLHSVSGSGAPNPTCRALLGMPDAGPEQREVLESSCGKFSDRKKFKAYVAWRIVLDQLYRYFFSMFNFYVHLTLEQGGGG